MFIVNIVPSHKITFYAELTLWTGHGCLSDQVTSLFSLLFFPPHLNPLSPLTSLYQCNFFSSVPLRHLFLSLVLTRIAILNCFINAFIFHYSIFYFVHKPGHAEPSADFRIRYPSGQSSFGNVNCLDTLDTKPCSQRLVSCSKGCAV